jgi:hypothetical protein
MEFAGLFLFNACGEGLDQGHVGLELLEVEEGTETELPKNGEDVHGKEVGVCYLSYLFEDVEGSHLVQEY